MNRLGSVGVAFLAMASFSVVGAACGSGTESTGGQGGTATSTNQGGGGAASSSSSSSGTTSSSSGSTSSSSGTTSSSSSGSTSSSSGTVAVSDPDKDGPYTVAEMDDTIASAPGGNTNLPVHCAYPTAGPTAGPYPVVVVGHGMQLAASQYYSYVKRLASHGYVALTVDFPATIFPPNVDNTKNAHDLLAGIDWAVSKPSLKADGNLAGMSGHSLGGKTAILAATLDPRVKATITLDPVDANGVDVSALVDDLTIPTAFIGETTDKDPVFGSPQACAPTAHNFQTFFAGAKAPSIEVTAIGAVHMSFLDNVSSCGLACVFCGKATDTVNAQVNAMARAYVVAFYERYLRGNTGYDAYLTGSEAQARYVTTGQATIATK